MHGAKVAISELEAIYDESNGWMRYDPATPEAAEPSDEAAEEASVVNEMAEPMRRGRRRAVQED
jgi:flagellar basal body rod protein FlgC